MAIKNFRSNKLKVVSSFSLYVKVDKSFVLRNNFSFNLLFFIFKNTLLNKRIDEQTKDQQNEANSFSPVAISSPHSQSFEDWESVHSLSDHFSQSSFDVFDTRLSLNFAKRPFSDIESNFKDFLEDKNCSNSWMRIQPSYHQEMSDVRIVIENDKSNHHNLTNNSFHSKREYNLSEDAGYQSLTNETFIKSYTNSKVNYTKILPDHIFITDSLREFQCNQFCCMTYINKLFIEIEEEKDEISTDTSDRSKNILRIPVKRLKRSSSTRPSDKLIIQNMKVSGYCYKRNRSTKESSKSSTTQNGHRTQTPHMRGYIALRQQCRLNEDLSPLTKSKTLIPKLSSSIEIGGIQKSKLKRKNAFKVHSKADDIGSARERIYKICESDSFLSTSSSFESLSS